MIFHKSNKRGQAATYIVWFISALALLLIAAFLAPMGVRFNTALFIAGETILNQSQDDIANIDDADIRASINASIVQAKASGENNIEVLTDVFQYSWVVVLGCSVLVLFLWTRRNVEYGQGGLV
jgi:hypothetical protein